jgi:hypothetical protein
MTPKFRCSNCEAEYLVVHVETPPTHDELPLLCLDCDSPLLNREGNFVLKFLRVAPQQSLINRRVTAANALS